MGKFPWAKLLRYSQYMDFRGNTFMVQAARALIYYIHLYLEQKIHRKTSKKPQKLRKLSPLKLSPFMVHAYLHSQVLCGPVL